MCSKEKELHSMSIHEVVNVDATSNGLATPCYSVMRVVGGWLYMYWDTVLQDYTREVFVKQ
jgi:hypothetical protein